jgi:hypothetical protein
VANGASVTAALALGLLTAPLWLAIPLARLWMGF